MSPNILITGAAGYIGGSLTVALSTGSAFVQKDNITAAVRSKEQADAFTKLGIKVVQLNLASAQAVEEYILHHNVDIVVHTASAIAPELAINLIDGLARRREKTGEEVFYVHTSGLAAFYEKNGWPQGTFKDSDPIFEIEKNLPDTFPTRKTDVAVIEHAKTAGVTSFIVVPSNVYGKGSGPWNQLSVILPPYVKASIAQQQVHKFPENTKVSAVHITDMAALYVLLIEKIIRKETVPNGSEGYYFALAHSTYHWEDMEHLAAALKARGLVNDTEVPTWASDEVAAEALGIPPEFVQPLWASGDNFVTENTRKLGWKPQWDRERYLRNIDDEIKAVLELGKPKSSLIGSLFDHAKKH